MWYDPYATLNRDSIINLVIGQRGVGKSYGLKRMAVENYLKNGTQFVYVRRYENEIKATAKTWFSDVINDMGYDVQYRNGAFEIEGASGYETIGFAIPLSLAYKYKSSSFPKVTLIIYDEFIPEGEQLSGYLPNEVVLFLNLYETIARTRENVVAFLLGNSTSFVSPYTMFWDIKNIQNGKGKAKNGLVSVEIIKDDEFAEKKRKTKFGMLIAGTQMEQMNINSEFILDSDVFVEKKTGRCTALFSIDYLEHSFTIWDGEDRLYVDETTPPSNVQRYTLTLHDHSPNKIMINNRDRQYLRFWDMFKRGFVRFDSIRTKAIMFELFKSRM